MRSPFLQTASLFLLTATIQVCSGQVSDGNLIGSVLDPDGLGVSHAKLELTCRSNGVVRPAESVDGGYYRFSNVPAGEYELVVTARGFSRAGVRGIVLQSGRTQTVNVPLALESLSSSMEVQSAAVGVDTATSTLQSTFSGSQLTALPLTGAGTGSLNNLSLLAAGVASSGGVGFGTGPSIGGQRPTSNNFTLEGIDSNNRATTGPLASPSNEAVAELTIQQNQFLPEFGHASAGQFNSVLKSGGNAVHGALYHYHQNRALNAVDESYRRQRLSQSPRFDQNRFGVSLGGPLVRNRVFGFTNIERQLQGRAAASPGAAFAPTADGYRMLSETPGVFSSNLEALRSSAGVASAASTTVNAFGQKIPVGILNTTGPSFTNDTRIAGTVDASVSPADEVRARFLMHLGDSIDNSPVLPSFYTPVDVRTAVVSLAHLHTFSSTFLSEMRLGLTRAVENRPASSATFPGLDAYPNIDITDLSLGMGSFISYPQSNRSNTIQFVENLSVLRGRHAFKFGYDARRYQSTFFFAQYQRGYYMYSTMERFLADITPEFGLRSVGGVPFTGDQFSHYTYAQDEFRITPNFTLSGGVRWEHAGVPEAARRQSLNGLASVPGKIEFRSPRASKTEFAPRVGLAWSPDRTGRTAVRAGWGMSYDQIPQNTLMNALPPQFFTMVEAHIEQANRPGFLAGGAVPGTPRPVTDAASARSQTYAWIPDQQRPYAMQWNAGVQRSLGNHYKLEVGYLGTKGVHLPLQTQLNRQAGAVEGRTLRTWFNAPSHDEIEAASLTLNMLSPVNTLGQEGFVRSITAYMPVGNSIYHGLATSLSRRYDNGLQFNFAHTWSHNIDDSTAVVASTVLTPRRPQDFFNLSAERADSMLDRRHRVSLGWMYDVAVPAALRNGWRRQAFGGWNVSGVWIAESGAPATVRSGIDSNLNADNAGDRTVINPNGAAGRSTLVNPVRNSAGAIVGYVAQNPNARYVQAGAGVLPNAGRNTLKLPGIMNVDLALSRRVRLTERAKAEFRAEAYNAFNHAQFVPGWTNAVDLRPRVSPAATSMLTAGNALFNRPDLALESNSRSLQLVLRVTF